MNSHPAILQLQTLGYVPGDQVYVRLLTPKALPREIALKRGLAFRGKDNAILPIPIDGYLTLTESGATFTRLKRDQETQAFAPTQTFNDGLTWLQTQNARGYGVYLVVNAGGREDKDIVRCPALFYECDKVSKEEQWRKVDSLKEAGLEPSLIIETRNSLHVYLNGEDILVSEFTELQQRLIQLQDSDPSIFNPSRLMRLAGFKHQQWNVEANRFEEPIECTIHAANDNRYSLTHFDASLPPWDEERWKAKSKASRVKRKGKATERHEPLNASDNPYDLRNLAHYLEGFDPNGRRNWITCKCPVHNGVSDNSLHINVSTGAYVCHAGCSPKEIRANVIRIGKTLGHKFPQPKNNIVPLRTPEESDEIENVQTQLRAFTYRPDLEFNEQYLPDNLDSQLPKSGLSLIRAAKGSGKSTVKKKLIAQAKREGRIVISITPRITLGEEQAAKWDIFYIDDLPVKFTINNAPTLGLCWDSLAKLLDKDLTNAVVIIDEAELGFMHLITSETCKDRRPRILAAFETIIQKVLTSGGLVILADADLTDISANYVKALAPQNTPIFTVVNNHKGKPWDIKFLTGNRYPLERRAISSVNAGNRIAIAADSQAEAEKLHTLIEKECPGKKVLRIDGKTSRLELTKRFLKQVNLELLKESPDVLIYTPSMGVGVSIDVPYFDEVYGFFFGKLEPSQCRQMLARVRQPVPRFVWARGGNHQLKGDKSFLPAEIKQRLYHYSTGGIVVSQLAEELTRLKAQCQNDTDALFHQTLIQTLGEMMAPDGTWQNAHLDLFAQVKARNNYGLKNLAQLLAQELHDEGHSVEEFKAALQGLTKLTLDGNPINGELPIQASAATLRQLQNTLDENAETVTPQGVTPEHDAPDNSIYKGETCATPPLTPTQRKTIQEALGFSVSDEAQNRKTKEAMAELRKEKEEEEAKRLAEAEVVTPDVAYEIMRNPFATEAERYQAQKTLLAESLPDVELTPDYVKKAVVADRRRWLTQVKNFWRLTHPEETKRKDRKTWMHHLREFSLFVPFLPDVKTHEPKFEVLRQIGLLRFIDDPTKEYCAHDPTVTEFFETCLKAANKLKTTWGVGVSRKHTNPIDLINRLLEKIGLKLRKTRQTRQGDDRIRYYALDEALLNDPDRIATLAAMDRKNVDGVTAESLTPQGVTPEHDAPNNSIYKGASCATPVPTSTPAVPVKGKTIRIYANDLYSEAMGLVIQGNTSSECVTVRILGGEYAGAEWIVAAGEYSLL